MRLVETLKNIWKVEELRQRILTTVFFVIIYRFGSHVVIPGIDPSALSGLQNQTKDGMLALLDMFSGGAFANASIFALGIMPYISASIMMQLAAILVPSMQKLQREGESGRRKIDQWTRYLTVLILLIQAPVYLGNVGDQLKLSGSSLPEGWWFGIYATVVMAAGSMFVLWLGERITDKGLGNGVSLIIMVGIIARLPHAFLAEWNGRLAGSMAGGLVAFLFEIVFLLFVIAGAIMLVQGARRVPVQYAKRVVGNKQYGGARQYIPLKVNSANVMPIIFAQAIMMLPIYLIGLGSTGEGGGFFAGFADVTGWSYNIVFALLILLFTYFYTAITINPAQIADDLKRNNGFIPGVKPGKATKQYIDTIMDRITLPGAFFLAIVAVLPALARNVLGAQPEFSQFFGGTSLLILVGVVLDTLQQVESHLLMRHYDGLLRSGRIKGRTGSVAAY